MKRSLSLKVVATAFHEAAHAVIAVQQGAQFDYIHIAIVKVPPRLYHIVHGHVEGWIPAGRVEFDDAHQEIKRTDALPEARIACAGVVAEKLLHPRTTYRRLWDHSQMDYEAMLDMLTTHFYARICYQRLSEDRKQHVQHYVEHDLLPSVKKTLKNDWVGICTVAQALLNRHRLGYSEVKRLIKFPTGRQA